MAFFKQLALVLGGLAGLAFLISFVLPGHWEVAREMQIVVDAREVHHVAGDLANWSTWSPWSKTVDPKATCTASANSSALGATYEWSGPELGKGSLKITASDYDKGVWFDLGLRNGREPVKGVLQYTELPNGGCMVKFSLRGDVCNSPVGRYVALMRGYTTGPDIVDSLLRLKTRVERGM